MKIEILKGRDIEKTRALYEEVFGDSREYTDYFYEKAEREGTAFAVSEYGETVSEMFLMPKMLTDGERRIDALYLYGVATKETYRRQGRMDRLMKEALCFAKNSKAELLYLIPVSSALYERYGFCTVKQKEVRIWEISKNKNEEPEYYFEPMSYEMLSEELCHEIHIFEKGLYGFRGLYPLRDREYFADRLCRAQIEGGGLYLIRKQTGSAVEGYLAVSKEDGEDVIMDIVGRAEEKQKITEDFLRRQKKERIKEYVFEIMVKQLRGEKARLSKVGINDEI